jgi:hypothetical protein
MSTAESADTDQETFDTIIRPVSDAQCLFDTWLDREGHGSDEWYLVFGSPVDGHSISVSDIPDELPDDEAPGVDGVVQVGHIGWAPQAFADEDSFVHDAGQGGGIACWPMGLLLVHESKLSEEALQTVAEAGEVGE